MKTMAEMSHGSPIATVGADLPARRLEHPGTAQDGDRVRHDLLLGLAAVCRRGGEDGPARLTHASELRPRHLTEGERGVEQVGQAAKLLPRSGGICRAYGCPSPRRP